VKTWATTTSRRQHQHRRSHEPTERRSRNTRRTYSTRCVHRTSSPSLRDDGTVASKPLSEHPDAPKVKGALKSGELWSLDGERDWVL